MKTYAHRIFFIACILSLAVALPFPCHAKEATPEHQSATGDYRIGCGDVLQILVWKEPSLTCTVTVRLDGKITVPLLDDLQAAGKTTMQLKKEIQSGLKKFIDGPFVTVTLESSGSQTFYILGEVAKTGEYPLTKKLTALQAFALAGGFTQWAQKKEILIFRRENGKERTIRIDYKDILKGKAKDDIYIKANDTIVVP